MQTKTIKLLGIREKTSLCRISKLKDNYTILLRVLSKDEEKELDDNQRIIIDNVAISKDNILCYGEIDLDVEDDYNFIESLNLINDSDNSNCIPSSIDWNKGVAYTNINVLRYVPTLDVMKWFEYNYILIGRPKRIIIYKVKSGRK